MDSDVAFDYSPRFRIFKNGRIERLVPETFIPPSLKPESGVVSKDAVYSPEKNLSLRIYLPQKSVDDTGARKIPLLVYFHGGAFIMETAFSTIYHTFLTSAVSAADCIAVSVDHRRAPEHPIPTAYEDSWHAIQWIFTHIAGSGSEDRLNKHADFSKVYLAGDSAGANIAHHMAIRAEKEKLSPENLKISGMILFHPYFLSKALIEEMEVGAMRYYERLCRIATPDSENGVEDPWINVVGSDLSALGCGRVLVMVAGNDVLARGGWSYAVDLKKCGWVGKVEVVETKTISNAHLYIFFYFRGDFAPMFVSMFHQP
ncbi:unnamed protein product [Arabidopsis lyrata]|uniref:Alpha/beta hydrolase fold-3 domain-containing protein n=1 Tax=Arabidopsis lyrata subsp. lyrata TaxID=81972 RepID=D7KHB0_ARALL|nr:probable carboxylesterase 1 [Arabidopsis lyrata subsp. lyrata]EFH66583.1 hypothetical protein ARALYDRAFT_889348 [Arabidopsis lyrata subsp. lyrata]CAH8252815.1 unnamed protein product [Arabidopsis lyrata]|eukprot:XP_002890324.1 probable carboxylesterase 1 [Arabidopsis lyrata subsp. lyrata]